MPGGYLLELKSFGVILMVGIVSLLLTSSFGAIDPNISFFPRRYIILRQGRRHLGWCQTCLTPIGIGRVDIFLLKGRIRHTVERSGIQCLMVLKILGVLLRTQV